MINTQKIEQVLNKFVELHKADITIREIKILSYRLGICGEKGTHTLEETGKLFGVTRERIRQMQAKVLEKLMKFDRGLDKYLKGE
jgi:RNA polymerase primary sigma factor